MLHLIVKENVILKNSKKYTICELSICLFIYFWFRNNSFQLLIAFYGNNKNMSNNESIYFNKYFSLCTIDGVESLLLKKMCTNFRKIFGRLKQMSEYSNKSVGKNHGYSDIFLGPF